ncbi:hypothetical protein DPMN_120565 [Dreissena polymorpha]|uniref:Uncharacterized protein n=1 Tax=Dreissena polymorpha TaxID=45954 RepID=A0A9D4JS87_DREPO|nr:hypothetical protein DPMN_120565 [Dreissena polymorpha]
MQLLTKFDIIGTNLLTNDHVFQANIIIFQFIQDFIETNLLTKFHEDWTINVASRVLTRKNVPPSWRPYIIGMNLLTKFHEDWTINVASRVKNDPPLDSHVFQAKVTIFILIQDIIGTHFLTMFNEDRKINVASRVKNAPPPGGYVFQPTGYIFELFQDIIGINHLTKFHEDWTINVASRVLTRFYYRHIRKNAPPLGSHVFQANLSIFELNRNFQKTHVLAKFPEDWTKNVTFRVFTFFQYIHIENTAPPPGGHVFSSIWTIFKLVRDINETNVSTKFHDDWAKIVTSRVFTRNTAPPTGSHTNILTNRGINGTSVLTKFHEDQTIKDSRVFTRQNVDDA